MEIKRFDKTAVIAIITVFAILGLIICLALTNFPASGRTINSDFVDNASFKLSDKEKKNQTPDERFNAEAGEGLSLFVEILAITGQHYYEDIDGVKERLIYPALREMVSRLDAHSYISFPAKDEEVCDWKTEEYKVASPPQILWEVKSFNKKRVGYLRIESFDDKAIVPDAASAVARLEAQKVKGIILDLRGNPGGWVDNCVGVLENFLPSGKLIITYKNKHGGDKVLTSDFYTDYSKIPLAVLVDEKTASSAEIMAGVLKDYKRAVIIGRKTYGKGSLNRPFPLSDGSVLVITTSMYYLPLGESIHHKGIAPHIQMDPSDDEAMTKKAEDVLVHWSYYKKLYLK